MMMKVTDLNFHMRGKIVSFRLYTYIIKTLLTNIIYAWHDGRYYMYTQWP